MPPRPLAATLPLLALLCLAGCAGSEAGPWDRFDGAKAMAHVRRLAEEIGPRPTGSQGEDEARLYIRRVLEETGLEVEELPIGWVDPKRYRGRALLDSSQLLARVPGTDPSAGRVLFSAHLDSRDIRCPGANDNASAVGVLLEAARVLAEEPLPAEALLLVTTAEEVGLLGARSYVQNSGVEGLDFALTLDPAGYGEMFVSPFPTAPPLWANQMFAEAARRTGARRTALDPAYLLVPRLLEVRFGADHVPFVEAGVPAFNLSGRLRRWNYHNELDTVNRIEPRTLMEAGRLSLALLDDAARHPPEVRDDPHYLVQPAGPKLLYLSGGMLLFLILAGAVAGLGAAVLTVGSGWRRVLVAAGFWVVVAFCALLPEKALERIHGYRYPWWDAQGRYLLLALLAAGLAAAGAVHLGRRLGLKAAGEEDRRALMGAAAGLCGLAALGLAPFLGREAGFYAAWPALVWGLWAMLPAGQRPTAGWAGPIAHAVVLVLGLRPLATLLSPALYRQALELLAYGLEPPPALMGLILGAGLLPPALFLAALPVSPLPTGRRTLAALALLFFVLLSGLAVVPPYGEGHPRTVRAHVLFPGPGLPSKVRLASFDNLRGLRAGPHQVSTTSTRIELEGPPRSPLKAELAWEPLDAGRGRLAFTVRCFEPASHLGVYLEGEGLARPEWEIGEAKTIVVGRAGQAREMTWEGVIEGPPGSSFDAVPLARWDAHLLGWKFEGKAAAWDITASVGREYGAQTFRFPE
jgi:hypothetical protein